MFLRLRTGGVTKILDVKNCDEKNAVNQQVKLGFVLEEMVTAPSVPKSDNRVEFRLGFSDEIQRTSLMVVWELMK